MDINLYKGESLQTADFIPLDLNEDIVIKLAENVNNYRAYQAEIAFLAGQLEPIHQNSPYVSLNGEIIKKYDKNLWTENPEIQSLLINMAIDAGVGVLSGSSGKNEVHFLSDVIPTRSPVDPAFREWCSFKGHLSRYQGWNAFNKGDFVKALDHCKKAGKLRDGFALEICSRIYYEGLGTSQSKEDAIYWMSLGADYGNYDMQKMLPWMYYWLDEPRHKEDAFIHFQGLAYANDSLPEHMVKDRNAEIMCGVMKRSGIGTYKDLQEAIGWFGIAARDGYADAQYYLGQMYEYGEGTAVDLESAYKWYRKASEHGMPENLQLAGGDPVRYRYHLDRKENWWLVVPDYKKEGFCDET